VGRFICPRPAMGDRVAAYETAVGLANQQGNYVWSSFASLAQSHSIFIGLSGLLLAASDSLSSLRAVSGLVAGLGIILCFIWILILARQFDFYAHWFAWARHLEKEAFGDTMIMLRSGRAYSDGSVINVSDTSSQLRMGALANIARIRHLAFAAVWVFLGIYLVILVAAIIR
jgi:hypothetical protein